MSTMVWQHPKVVSPDEWLAARKKLLKKEKEFFRAKDALSAERQELPWVKVEKNYEFESVNGKMSLSELFDGRSQLIVYHFMFAPEWEAGCHGCSFVADHLDGTKLHLAQRDVTLAAISRAPIEKLEAFRKRMGWKFQWVSSQGTTFNRDFHVQFTKDEMAKGKMYYNYAEREFPMEEGPGASAFYKDADGEIFHTYSTYSRGVETLLGTYNLLDMAPKGRDEDHLDFSMSWVKHHDRYEQSYFGSKPGSGEKSAVKGAQECCKGSGK